MSLSFFFFFNDTATTEIYTLSLPDALPISQTRNSHLLRWASEFRPQLPRWLIRPWSPKRPPRKARVPNPLDRKSTRLNSSHANISYAVFCLKKKKTSIHQLSHYIERHLLIE